MDLMERGGVVMWPILGLSILAVALAFERAWFFLATNNPVRLRRVAKIARMLRAGDREAARVLAEDDSTVYGSVLRMIIEEGTDDAVMLDAIEQQRTRLERFMPTLSTVITMAPMLGILGTVTGIISSFQILSDQTSSTDPRLVSQGIAEALLTTAAGLVVAITVLVPYNIYRAQIDRTLGRLESLCASASRGSKKA